MIRSQFASALALAAFLAAPAFAQTTTGSNTTAATGTPTATTGTTATQPMPRNPATAAQQAAVDQGRKPLCSELNHPNAGKHADKTTGKAATNSASPVHMDCIADGTTASTATDANTSSTTAAKKKPAKTASSTAQ